MVERLTSLILSIFLLSGCSAPQADKASTLWRIVSSCAQNQQLDHTPAPCEYVNLEEGYVVLKDIRGKTQYLLMPTDRISGIESPQILKDGATNYWQKAWEAREYVFKRAGRELPPEDIGMAINSLYGRSQNQLHIHIDCLKPQVIAILRKQKFSDRWSPVHFASLHTYEARRLDSDDLDENPFTLLAAHAKDMSRETLVVAGSEDGFILLSDTASGSDKASGEELLDHECAVNQMKE